VVIAAVGTVLIQAKASVDCAEAAEP